MVCEVLGEQCFAANADLVVGRSTLGIIMVGILVAAVMR